MLVVKLALVVLFELALLGKILEAALRHECTIALGVDGVGRGFRRTGNERNVQVS